MLSQCLAFHVDPFGMVMLHNVGYVLVLKFPSKMA